MGLADLIRAELERMAGLRQPAVSSWPEREAALEAVRVFDVEHGYRAPSSWDHVHQVERDAPPVLMVTNRDGTREPWSLEWQVADDARDRIERSMAAFRPTDEGCLGG